MLSLCVLINILFLRFLLAILSAISCDSVFIELLRVFNIRPEAYCSAAYKRVSQTAKTRSKLSTRVRELECDCRRNGVVAY